MSRGSMPALAFYVALVTNGAVAQSQQQTSVAPVTQSSSESAPAGRNDYRNGDNWLCRPGRQDACAVDLTTTIVAANGTLTQETFKPDPKAPIDCFYVYPTVSRDATPNSDMNPGPEEKGVIRAQFARFSSVCRPYAPLYRQVTLRALVAAMAGMPTKADWTLTYQDVLDAWNDYLQHDNHGRGVVLIGHSQGSLVLTRLIADEIEGKPARKLVVSALLAGTAIRVPKGKDVGGTFKNMPLCRSDAQTGCVITYASFRSNVPPPPMTRFARVDDPTMIAACTNPAALAGGSAELHAYLSAGRTDVGVIVEAKPWVTPAKPINTPFVSVPGLITAECVSDEHGSYLAITVHGDPADPRTDDIAGDVIRDGKVLPEWGLHLIDMNVAMGSLLDVVRKESRTFLRGTKR